MPRKKGVDKEATVIRLTREARVMLDKLAAKQGMSLAVCVETLIRREAEARGITGDESDG